MLNRGEVDRMQRNVETFQDRAREFEAALAAFRSRQRARLPSSEIGSTALTQREVTILRMVADGSDNGHIALAMHFALGTIKLHVREILDKLGASTRTEAAVQAVRRGLI